MATTSVIYVSSSSMEFQISGLQNPCNTYTQFQITLYQGSTYIGVYTWTDSSTGTSTSYTIGGLSCNTSYTGDGYANYGGTNYGCGSATSTTEVCPPSAPTSLSATNITTTSATLNCSSVSGATSYTFHLYNQGNGSLVLNQTVSGPSCSATGLSSSTEYYFNCYASNAGGNSAYSANYSFYTATPNSAPNAPTHKNISSNGYTISSHPKFWFGVGDSDGDTIQNIEVQVSTDSTFASVYWDAQYGSDSGYGTNYGAGGWTGMPANNGGTVTACFSSWSGLSPTGTWYVRARCKDSYGYWSGWSSTQQFTFSAPPWTDTPAATGHGFLYNWLNDIWSVTYNVRAFRAWGTVTALDHPLSRQSQDILAFHVIEREKYVIDACNSFANASQSWSEAGLKNLLTANQMNGGDEWNNTNGMSSYAANGSNTLSVDTSTYRSGVASYKVVNGYSAAQSCSINTSGTISNISASTEYTAGVWVRTNGAPSVNLVVWWRQSSGANSTIKANTQHTVNVSPNTWTFVTLTDTSPSDAAQSFVELYFNNLPASDAGWWDDAFLVQGNPFNLDKQGQHIIDLRNNLALI